MHKLFINRLRFLCYMSITCVLTMTVSLVAMNRALAHANNKNILPEIGVVAANTLPLQDEVEIGRVYFSQLRGQNAVLQDPVVQQYIQSIGNELVIHADNTKFPFTFFVVNNQSINAFAFFGGHIGIHTGLFYHADDEAELAAVLAHEIAHVTQRHIVRRMAAQEKASPLQIASMIGGAILMMASPQAGMAAIYAGQGAAIQQSINYTRGNEKEADRIGIRILAESGFDPFAAARFFDKMTEQTRWGSKPPAFLLTHPVSTTRSAEARNRAANLPSKNRPSSLAFHLIKARIAARYFHTANYNITWFEEQLKKQTILPEAAYYGLAIAHMRKDEYSQALAYLLPLWQKDPENYAYIDALTDIYIGLGQFTEAQTLLEPLNNAMPNNPVILLNYANQYIEAKQSQAAVDLLKDFVMVHPESTLGWRLLSNAHASLQSPMLMHQANAEWYYLLGAYRRAIEELQFALNYAESHLVKQRMRARMEQFRASEERMKTLVNT